MLSNIEYFDYLFSSNIQYLWCNIYLLNWLSFVNMTIYLTLPFRTVWRTAGRWSVAVCWSACTVCRWWPFRRYPVPSSPRVIYWHRPPGRKRSLPLWSGFPIQKSLRKDYSTNYSFIPCLFIKKKHNNISILVINVPWNWVFKSIQLNIININLDWTCNKPFASWAFFQ